jgi:hypothetical protein
VCVYVTGRRQLGKLPGCQWFISASILYCTGYNHNRCSTRLSDNWAALPALNVQHRRTLDERTCYVSPWIYSARRRQRLAARYCLLSISLVHISLRCRIPQRPRSADEPHVYISDRAFLWNTHGTKILPCANDFFPSPTQAFCVSSSYPDFC